MMPDLLPALIACVPLLPDGLRRANARLLRDEHLGRLATRLAAFHLAEVPDTLPPPHLPTEVTPPVSEAWEPFRGPVARWAAGGGAPNRGTLDALARAFVEAGTGGVLLLLGQQRTPGSVTDERATSPRRADLLAAAAVPCGRGPLTAAARALEKHAGRGTGSFWGEVRGAVAEKNRAAEWVVARVLDGASWWNVFPLGGRLIYEVRVPPGHGARWSVPTLTFVGLVEPFGLAAGPG